MKQFESEKDLFSFIRGVVDSSVPSLKDIFKKYDWKLYSASEAIPLLYNDDTLLIDGRSEKEFDISHLPGAINFPILTTIERHFTGLIYKKYSQQAAVWLAMQYADPKSDELARFLGEHDAKNKNILVYCWRGGGRSSYLAKMISDLGYSPSRIEGGFKAYRSLVVELFSMNTIPFGLIELSGLTGSGKTELLNSVKNDFPVIDLELSARHYSSIFGQVPYDNLNYEPIHNQSSFENNIYGDIIRGIKKLPEYHTTYLVESESKKVGDFFIPKSLFNAMKTCPSVSVGSSLESRVKRIVNDYFGAGNKGITRMLEIMRKNESFLKSRLSKEIYTTALSLLESGDTYTFTELMMVKYYDKIYKDKHKTPLAVINNDNPIEAKQELLKILM
ncbi:MAG: tRNA 2-selenouridine(34) synthase MnmH [Ignavibacteriae bacterium]|nr:tRNA 2-selenouridine(34) synthase MnmH [Ignavibacteriota bacterium]